MHATYRLRRSYLHIALGGLPFHAAMASLFLGGWVSPEESSPHPLAARLFSAIPVGFCLLSIYLVLAWRNGRLMIDGKRIAASGAFRTVEMDLDKVTRASWLCGGSVKLVASSGSVRIVFRGYDVPSSLPLIEHLRHEIPESVQVGWFWFEHNYVRRALEKDKPGEGKVLKNPRRMDRIVIPGAAAISIAGAGAARALHDARMVLVAAGGAAIVVAMRYSSSRDGSYVQTIGAACREEPELKWLLALFLLSLAGMAICGVARTRFPNVLEWFAGALSIAVAAVFVSGIRGERRRRRTIEEKWRASGAKQSP